MTRTLEILHGPESYIYDYIQPERRRGRIAEPAGPREDHGRAGIRLKKPGPGPRIAVRTHARPTTSAKPAPPTPAMLAALRKPAPSSPEMLRALRKPVSREEVPAAKVRFSDVYSNAHQKILLRTDHIERMDAVRKAFNKRRAHQAKRSLTTSDLVNACLDFVFEHPIPFDRLDDAEGVRGLLRCSVYLSAVRRWREFNESF